MNILAKMPVYQISYQTKNTYSPTIHEAVLEFLVFPDSNNEQEVLDFHFEIIPNEKPSWGKNIYGFDVLRFRIKQPIQEFEFRLSMTVKKELVNPFGFIPLSYEEERKILNSDEYQIDQYPFLSFSNFTHLPDSYEFLKLNKNEGIFDFVKRTNIYVNKLISYDNDINDPHRQIDQTLNENKGVCQDYAHLMLAVLRKNNIPARYVSGYLNQGNDNLGTGAVHAWIQAHIPGIGWLGFDPTNAILEDHHYIKIAHGTDISDCMTLKGVIKGAETNQTDYHVLVVEQSNKANQ